MRSCKLFDSKACGLLLAGAAGDFEDNEIYNSATDGRAWGKAEEAHINGLL
jgi:hypothetical protein